MRKTTIFTWALIPVIVALGYLLYAGIKENIDTAENVKKSEALVIERLKEIREVQKWFLLSNGRYCGTWDSLTNFIKEGTIYIVEKKETIIQRPASQSHLGDSVRVSFDTLGRENVQKYLFPADKYAGFVAENLYKIPTCAIEGFEKPATCTDCQFTIYAGKIKKGNVMVDVLEVIDSCPVDPTRKESSENRKRKFLRFGSRDEVTTSGNWED
ncbi:MAG: hypothetical protein EAZ08_06415 [Cytophagales bacterium]|nr:MAG: hypothetical protein EAZ08_06415 [Cytophagales bacterium]